MPISSIHALHASFGLRIKSLTLNFPYILCQRLLVMWLRLPSAPPQVEVRQGHRAGLRHGPQAEHAEVIRVTRTLRTTCRIVKPVQLYSHIVRTDFLMAALPPCRWITITLIYNIYLGQQCQLMNIFIY